MLFVSLNGLDAQDKTRMLESKVDSLLLNAIDSAAFPGAQVLIMHKNQVILHKSYGYHTYEKKRPVQNHHLYDLASVTKVMAGGLSLMKLEEDNLFSPNFTLKQTHPSFEGSDKGNTSWKSILAHQARMKPYIVFWQTTLNNRKRFKWRTFSGRRDRYYNISIDNTLNLHRRYPKRMYKLIRSSQLEEDEKYLYSGLGFLLIPDLIKKETGKTLDVYLNDEVYAKLEHSRISFKPSLRFPLHEIVPTEVDTFFRNKLVHGYVHDENASMLGGVSANAGLFSDAMSLAHICKELLDPESQVFDPKLVKNYTATQFPENDNRRGLTFDKPSLDPEKSTYIAKSASPSSFGHSGFTGTFFWVDPEHQLTLVFLSNRVHPYRSNRKLYTMNFRPQLHQLAYDYLVNAKE